DYSKAIDLEPADALVYSSRGLVLINLGKFEDAIADYSKVIQLNPNDAWAYHNRGIALEKLGRREEADHDYAKANALYSIA
ncbi:MAG: tetratricopeptide repeat protein, partial [Planctomycetia bacterium]